MSALVPEDLRKPCCREADNLKPETALHSNGFVDRYKRCIVCGCRHFELVLDPGRFGVRGAPLG